MLPINRVTKLQGHSANVSAQKLAENSEFLMKSSTLFITFLLCSIFYFFYLFVTAFLTLLFYVSDQNLFRKPENVRS